MGLPTQGVQVKWCILQKECSAQTAGCWLMKMLTSTYGRYDIMKNDHVWILYVIFPQSNYSPSEGRKWCTQTAWVDHVQYFRRDLRTWTRWIWRNGNNIFSGNDTSFLSLDGSYRIIFLVIQISAGLPMDNFSLDATEICAVWGVLLVPVGGIINVRIKIPEFYRWSRQGSLSSALYGVQREWMCRAWVPGVQVVQFDICTIR